MNGDMYKNVFAFLDAQHKAEQKGEHEFKCPICGHQAWWDRAKINGHLHTACPHCKMRVME